MLTSQLQKRVTVLGTSENSINNITKIKYTPYKDLFSPNIESVSNGYINKIDNDIIATAVDMLRKGDKIINSNNNISEILCVIKTPINDNICGLVDVNGVKVTKQMPVKIINKYDQNWTGDWILAKNVGLPCVYYGDYVYNFILNNGNMITVNDIDILTFDLDKNIDKLIKNSGWKYGLILNNSNNLFE